MSRVRGRPTGVVAACGLLVAAAALVASSVESGQMNSAAPAPLAAKLHAQRISPTDLEVGGDLAGLPAGTTRYATREDLLALPQVTYTVTDDPNFTGPTQVKGVLLEELMRDLGAAPAADLMVAICDDRYRANYRREYLAQHHPVLALEVNGKAPSGWPKDSGGHGFDMGPYMISHARFTPSFKILSHADEPQIPWGVIRLEFRDEKTVFGAIRPSGPFANGRGVQDGYKIARQNCFRCHNAGEEGGEKSGVSWAVLSAVAVESPEFFKDYVRDPRSKSAQAEMPGNPAYDDETLRALAAYFRSFSQRGDL